MFSTSLKAFLVASVPRPLKPLWSRLEASPIGYRLARGAFWSLLGTVAARVLALGASVLAARLLGKGGFGELGIIQSTMGMFGAVAGFGLGLTATKHMAEFRTANSERAGRILRMSGLMSWLTGGLAAVAMAGLAPWLARTSLAAPHLAGVLQLSALYLLLMTVNGNQMGVLAGFEAFQRIAWVNLWSGGLYFACMTVGCWWHGLTGAVWGLVAAQALGCLISRRAIVQEARAALVPILAPGWSREIPLLWRFSLPTVLTGVLGMPVAWICQALVARQPNGYEQVADYYSAMQLRNIPLTLVGVIVAAILPVYAQTRSKDGPTAQRKVLRLTQALMVLTILPLLLIMAVFAQPILLSYGKSFVTGSLILRLLLLSVVFEALANCQVQVMVGNGQVWPLFFFYLLGCLVFAGLALGLVPTMLGTGLAWATVGWQAVRWLTSSLYLLLAGRTGGNVQQAPATLLS